ncbi:MAG: hypothetical protein HZA24_08125 [Nitrospirae bacterium]|nr:hypothetical protein [Nitrospirota bacterium]
MNLPANAHGAPLVRTVLVGGDPQALALIPALARDPQFNLVGVLPTHPADLLRNLADHGYELADPCPIAIYADVAQLVDVAPDLIVDASAHPGTARVLEEAGLGAVPRVNPAALHTLMARHPATAPAPPAPPEAFAERLAKEVGRAYRHGQKVALVLFRFQPANPVTALEHGQLERVRQVLAESVRLEDTVTPWGERGVALLLPETGDTVRHVVARLTSNLADHRIRQGVFGGPVPRSSVGWAWFPQDAKTASALMDQALARMGPHLPLGS